MQQGDINIRNKRATFEFEIIDRVRRRCGIARQRDRSQRKK